MSIVQDKKDEMMNDSMQVKETMAFYGNAAKSRVNVLLNVPSEMERFFNQTDAEYEFERNAMILYPFIRNLTISHGRAAEILGVSKLSLIDYYCSIGIPYLNMSKEELEEEIAFIKGSNNEDAEAE